MKLHYKWVGPEEIKEFEESYSRVANTPNNGDYVVFESTIYQIVNKTWNIDDGNIYYDIERV